ncbi:protein dpy-30 homolog isoform X2 [Saccopteryx bilineata]|uniref:protein dpy-30 homolog isoform X2 n=1 Tax=Saccopteryx bilineata TaxID=59482 RepID=UPI00338DDF4A
MAGQVEERFSHRRGDQTFPRIACEPREAGRLQDGQKLSSLHARWGVLRKRVSRATSVTYGGSGLCWELVARCRALSSGVLRPDWYPGTVICRVRHGARADAGGTDAGCRKSSL